MPLKHMPYDFLVSWLLEKSESDPARQRSQRNSSVSDMRSHLQRAGAGMVMPSPFSSSPSGPLKAPPKGQAAEARVTHLSFLSDLPFLSVLTPAILVHACCFTSCIPAV